MTHVHSSTLLRYMSKCILVPFMVFVAFTSCSQPPTTPPLVPSVLASLSPRSYQDARGDYWLKRSAFLRAIAHEEATK